MPHHEHFDLPAGPRLVTTVTPSADLTRAEVQLSGELDDSDAGSLQALLDGLLHEGYRRVAVDLAELRFLGCAGLTVFVRTHRSACTAGAELLFTRPTPMTRRILRITELDRALVVRTARDAAAGPRSRSSASSDAA